MISEETRSLIREMVEAELLKIALTEGRKIGGFDVEGLSMAERDELESFISGYINADQIESRKVRDTVRMGSTTRVRRDPDDVSTIKRKPAEMSGAGAPAAPKPVRPGFSVGQVSGWHESLKPTDRFGGNKNKETGDWMRFRIKTKQADPHWVWTGKRWVSDTEFERLGRMGYLPER